MKRKTRYFFIFSGLIIFLILTPLIILYVGGVTYDRSDNRYVKTGILVAKSDPSGATVLVDGKESGHTPANVRFLKPGGYEVTMTKDGYYPWTKRLNIEGGKVSYTAEDFPEIYLLKKAEVPVIVAEGIKDFYLEGNKILYLGDKGLFVSEIGQTQAAPPITLPHPADHISADPEGNYFLLTGPDAVMVYNGQTKIITDVTNLAKGLGGLVLANDNNVYGLKNNQLIEVDWQNNKTKVIQGSCQAFAILNGALYTLQAKSLLSAPLAQPGQTQILLDNLPELNNARVLISSQKDIFISANGNLYRAGSQLNLLAGNIGDLEFNPGLPSLSFISNSQAEFYDFENSQLQLITRSSAGVRMPTVSRGIDYAFLGENNKVRAWELNARDRQNNYTLMEAPSGPAYGSANQAITKLAVDKNNKTLYALQGGMLRFLEIH